MYIYIHIHSRTVRIITVMLSEDPIFQYKVCSLNHIRGPTMFWGIFPNEGMLEGLDLSLRDHGT